ncbi:reverse transcriptase domain-containing protein, partial [Tanacetum coccineum]
MTLPQAKNYEDLVSAKVDTGSNIEAFASNIFYPSLSWKDFAWSRAITRMQIIIKGVLTHKERMETIKVVEVGVDYVPSDFCEEHYEDILPVIMDKIRRDKRKEVHTRLNFGDNTKRSRRTRESSQNSSARTWSVRHQNPSKKPRVKDRSRDGDGNVFGRLGHRRQSAFDRLSNTYSPSTTKSGPDRTSSRDHSKIRGRPHRWDSPLSRVRSRSKDRSHGVKESYDNTYSSYRTESRHGHRSRDRGRSRTARVWFDELPPESIDGYKDLKAAFLAYFMQQKKYVKYPVEIHNIKQRDGETLKDFMKRFKVET